jgi:hypothetical protein
MKFQNVNKRAPLTGPFTALEMVQRKMGVQVQGRLGSEFVTCLIVVVVINITRQHVLDGSVTSCKGAKDVYLVKMGHSGGYNTCYCKWW